MSLTSSRLSSGGEIQKAIDAYGKKYGEFLLNYPTLQKETRIVTSIKEAAKKDAPTFVEIDREYGKGASELWIKYQLVELMMFLGAMETVGAYQVKALAARIRAEYYHLTPVEFKNFVYLFSIGDYGKLYAGRTVNPQDIMMGMHDYMLHLYEQRAAVYTDSIAKEQEANKEKGISWEEYCKMKGKDPSINPFTLRKKINKNL